MATNVMKREKYGEEKIPSDLSSWSKAGLITVGLWSMVLCFTYCFYVNKFSLRIKHRPMWTTVVWSSVIYGKLGI